MTDEALLKRFAANADHNAFALLTARHMDWIYALARRMLGDAHLAEDATQAVFLLLSRKAAGMSAKVRVTGWLFNSVRLVCRDIRKMQKRRQLHETRAARDLVDQDDLTVVLPLIDDAVATLGEADRLAVLLRFHRGMEYGQVAEELQTTPEGARKRVDRALVKMRAYLASRAGDLPDTFETKLATQIACIAPTGLAGAIASAVSGSSSPAVAALALRAADLLRWAKIKAVAAVVAVATGVAGVTAGVVATQMAGSHSVATAPSAATQPVLGPGAASEPYVEPRTWGQMAEQYRRALQRVSTVTSETRLGGNTVQLVLMKRGKGVRVERGSPMELHEIVSADGTVWQQQSKGWIKERIASESVLDGLVRTVGWPAGDSELLVREPSKDQKVVEGMLRAYRMGMAGSPIVLIDDKGLIRRKHVSLSSSGPEWIWGVQYDSVIADEMFVAPAAAVNAADADEWFEQHYPLSTALWQREYGASVVALHSVALDGDGRIYLRLSTRLTDAVKEVAPATAWCLDESLKWRHSIVDYRQPEGRLVRAAESYGRWWWTAWLVYERAGSRSVPTKFELPLRMGAGSSWWLEANGFPSQATVVMPVNLERERVAGTYQKMMGQWFEEISEAGEMSSGGTLVAWSERRADGRDSIEGRSGHEQTSDGFGKAVKTILAIPGSFYEAGVDAAP